MGFPCPFHSVVIDSINPHERVAEGYSNAAVVLCLCLMLVCVRQSMRGPWEHDRDFNIVCFFVKLGRHGYHNERMGPIDFVGQWSRSQSTCMVISLRT